MVVTVGFGTVQLTAVVVTVVVTVGFGTVQLTTVVSYCGCNCRFWYSAADYCGQLLWL